MKILFHSKEILPDQRNFCRGKKSMIIQKKICFLDKNFSVMKNFQYLFWKEG